MPNLEGFGRRPKQTNAFAFKLDKLRSQIDSITIDATMQHILNISNLKMRIEIDQESHAQVMLIDQQTGERAGPLSDLIKMAEFSTFIKNEEEVESNITILRDVEAIICQTYIRLRKAHTESKSTRPFELRKVDAQRLVQLKTFSQHITRCKKNLEYVKKFIHDSENSVKQCARLWESWGNVALDCLTESISCVLETDAKAVDLDSLLLKGGTPKWCYKYITTRSLEVVSDIRRALFPNDPTKGVELSIREWIDPDFVRLNEFLLSNSGFVIRLLQNREELRKVFGIRDMAFAVPSSLTGPAREAYGIGILVPPLYFGLTYAMQPNILGKPAHFPRKTDLTKRGEILSLLVQTYIKAITFRMTFNSQLTSLWNPLLAGTGLDIRDQIRPGHSIFSIILENKDATAKRCKMYALGASSEARDLLVKHVAGDLSLPMISEEYALLLSVLNPRPVTARGWNYDIHGTSKDVDLQGRVVRYTIPERFVEMDVPLDKDQADLRKEIMANVGVEKRATTKKRQKREINNPLLSTLSTRAKRTIDQLRKMESTAPFAESIAHWLGEFVHRKCQDAAVQFIRVHYANNHPDFQGDDVSDVDNKSNPDLGDPDDY